MDISNHFFSIFHIKNNNNKKPQNQPKEKHTLNQHGDPVTQPFQAIFMSPLPRTVGDEPDVQCPPLSNRKTPACGLGKTEAKCIDHHL